MYKQIQWGESNPFTTSEPLKITLHVQSFENIAEDEEFALDVLMGLLHRKELLSPVLTLKANDFPYLVFDDYHDDAINYPFTIYIDENTPIQHSEVSLQTFSIEDYQKINIYASPDLNKLYAKELGEQIRQDILFLSAHETAKQQLFVSCSAHLLSHRLTSNICSPKEAMKVIGLLLRERGMGIHGDLMDEFELEGLFELLIHSQLPHLGYYLAVCIASHKYRQDNTFELADAVVRRAVWAIQARDEITREFYTNRRRAKVVYHFTYLTVLIVGMFDAMAIIAHRAYNLAKSRDENYASFWKSDFLDKLSKIPDAKDLYEIISSQKFKDLTRLVKDFRNTIHHVAIDSIKFSRGLEPEYVLLTLPPDNDIVNIIEKYSDLESWGFAESRKLSIEPLTYADTLLKQMFIFIDEIAKATHVEELLPARRLQVMSNPANEQEDTLQEDILMEEKIQRIVLLGW